tara:strand:+ start:489 stop:1337 length:849 start_codon:yes stop_codon:yes gene_type:complete
MSVEKMCELLEVSRNAYYNWKKDRQAKRKAFKAMITKEVLAIHELSKQSYGSPRITKTLHRKGILVSRQFVARIMKSQGIRASQPPKFVVTTDSDHNNPIAKNLLNRKFEVHELGKVWVSDITYIKVKSDWAYLTTVIDLADRKVIGWSVSADMTTENTVIKAWNRAKINRPIINELLFHSDRGVQYTSNRFRNILSHNKNVTQSMSRKGNCWDNAVAESFFKTIKHERLNQYNFKSIQEVKRVVFEYIEYWYNRMRLHSALAYKTPFEREIELKQKYKNVA